MTDVGHRSDADETSVTNDQTSMTNDETAMTRNGNELDLTWPLGQG